MATLNKTRVLRSEIKFEDRDIVIKVNPDLTAEISVLGRPTTKLIINLLEQYLASKKINGVHSTRKTFVLQGKEVVIAAPTAKTDGLEITENGRPEAA